MADQGDQPRRKPGRLKGKIHITADFNQIPDEIIASMERTRPDVRAVRVVPHEEATTEIDAAPTSGPARSSRSRSTRSNSR